MHWKRSISPRIVVFTLLLAMSFSSLAVAQETKLQTLLDRSPKLANAMSYMHLPSLRKLLAEADMQLSVPENIDEVWLISDLDTLSLTPLWEAGYATLKEKVEAKELAEITGGYIDVFGKRRPFGLRGKAIWSHWKKQESVSFDQQTLAASKLGQLDCGSSAPMYLASQAKQAEEYLSLLVTIDLEDAMSEVSLTQRLSSFDAAKGQDAGSLAKVLASAKGMSVIVGRRSLSECILSIEFGQSPASLLPLAKPLLNEMLNRNGTSAPEILGWAVKAEGNKLKFQGAISSDSLDGLIGIFSIRYEAEEITNAVAASNSQVTGDSRTETASKEYFDKVNAFIERVRKYKAQSTGFRAKWNEQQARRIDEIGTLNVDPQLVEYAADVANVLRNNGMAIRSGNVAAGQRQAAQAENWGYGGGYYGGYYGGYNTRQSAQRGATTIGAQQRMAGFGSFQEALAEIDQMTADIRREMTEKYGVQF